jgi:putative flippase GtrA
MEHNAKAEVRPKILILIRHAHLYFFKGSYLADSGFILSIKMGKPYNMYSMLNNLKVRFLLVGAFNTLVGALAVLSAQYVFGRSFSPQFIFLSVTLLCSIPAFFLMKIFAFQTKGKYMSEYIKYITAVILNILLGSLLVFAFYDLLAFNVYVSQFAGIVSNVVFAYLLHANFTFKH